MRADPDDFANDDDQGLRAALAAVSADLLIERQHNRHLRAWIQKLEMTIARMNRARFGRSSERLDREAGQLQLLLDELRAEMRQVDGEAVRPARIQPRASTPLPEHLPREIVHHASPCQCPQCGGTLQRVGEDVSEMLEFVPARFKVLRHVRPKLSCVKCRTMTQAPAPSRPIARGLPGPGLLAHVAVSKFADALPLYRQSQIYAREGVDLARSTLADWLVSPIAVIRPADFGVIRPVMRVRPGISKGVKDGCFSRPWQPSFSTVSVPVAGRDRTVRPA